MNDKTNTKNETRPVDEKTEDTRPTTPNTEDNKTAEENRKEDPNKNFEVDANTPGEVNDGPDVRAIPDDPSSFHDGSKDDRIEYLRAKTDRTVEEGLELQELELGVEKSKEVNAGQTSDQVHQEQAELRAKEEQKEAEGAKIS